MISGSGLANRDSTKRGVILNLTLKEHLKRLEDPPVLWRPNDMQPMCNPHKPTQRCSQKCYRTTQWRWQILQRRHKPTRHRLRFWPKLSRSSQHRWPPSPQKNWRRNQKMLVSKNLYIVWPTQAPQPSSLLPVNKLFMRRADKSSTPTGIVHHTVLRWRKPILPWLASTRLMNTKNLRRDWILTEENNGTSIVSMADQLIEGGQYEIAI